MDAVGLHNNVMPSQLDNARAIHTKEMNARWRTIERHTLALKLILAQQAHHHSFKMSLLHGLMFTVAGSSVAAGHPRLCVCADYLSFEYISSSRNSNRHRGPHSSLCSHEAFPFLDEKDQVCQRALSDIGWIDDQGSDLLIRERQRACMDDTATNL